MFHFLFYYFAFVSFFHMLTLTCCLGSASFDFFCSNDEDTHFFFLCSILLFFLSFFSFFFFSGLLVLWSFLNFLYRYFHFFMGGEGERTTSALLCLIFPFLFPLSASYVLAPTFHFAIIHYYY